MACEINKVILKAKNLRVVGETSISIDKLTNILIQKVQKTKKNDESCKVQRIENKETNKLENNNSTKIQNKIKIINILSSKVDKQAFFDVIDKIDYEKTQKQYL